MKGKVVGKASYVGRFKGEAGAGGLAPAVARAVLQVPVVLLAAARWPAAWSRWSSPAALPAASKTGLNPLRAQSRGAA